MAITHQGSASAASTSVAIPTHAVGDIIILFVYRDGSTTAPSKPTASGTVPAWVDINAGAGQNTNSSRSAYFVATATNHTTGTWTNATGIAAVVLRGQQISNPIGGTAETGGTANSTATSPSITPTRTNGTSFQLHCYGHRTVTAWDAAPSGYTRRTSVATEVCINTKDDTTTGTGVAQTFTSSNSGSRRETIEILAELAAHTMACDVGSYTYSGVEPIFAWANRTLIPDVGSYTLTGVDPVLARGRTLRITRTTGAVDSTSVTVRTGTGFVTWTNGSNLITEDGTTGYCKNTNTAGLQPVDDLDFKGFDLSEIPDSAAIVGVKVEVKRYEVGTIVGDALVCLLVDGEQVGDNKLNDNGWASSLQWDTFGGPTDPWGLSLTGADVKDPDFGFCLSPSVAGTILVPGGAEAHVDHVRMTVYYEMPGSYEITGVEPSLQFNRVIPLDAGSYTLTGVDPDLTYTPGGGGGASYFLLQIGDHLLLQIGDDLLLQAAGAGAYELACDLGTYTITGTDPALYFGRVVFPDAGVYSVTGADPDLYFGRTVLPDAGVYSLTGTEPTLDRTYVVPMDVGSYAVTGVDPELQRAHVVPIDVGSYTYTGIDVDLVYGQVGSYTINLDEGAYALTGIEPALQRTHLVPIDVGSYVVTGTEPNLEQGYAVEIDAGVYAMTGTDADLYFGRTVLPDAGVYSVTGTEPALQRSHVVPMDAGSYSMTGVDPALQWAHVLAPDVGVYTLTGNDVTLTYEQPGAYVIVCDMGTYTITGTEPQLQRAHLVPVDVGSYSMTGTEPSLQRGYSVPLDVGVYAAIGAEPTFSRTYVLACDIGSYTQTGIDVGLYRGYPIAIDAGVYVVTGNDLEFDRTYVLLPNVGSYLVTGTAVTFTHGGIITPTISVWGRQTTISVSGTITTITIRGRQTSITITGRRTGVL